MSHIGFTNVPFSYWTNHARASQQIPTHNSGRHLVGWKPIDCRRPHHKAPKNPSSALAARFRLPDGSLAPLLRLRKSRCLILCSTSRICTSKSFRYSYRRLNMTSFKDQVRVLLSSQDVHCRCNGTQSSTITMPIHWSSLTAFWVGFTGI